MPTLVLESDLKELFYDLHESGLFKDGKEISDAILTSDPKLVLKEYRVRRHESSFDLMTFFGKYFHRGESGRIAYETNPDHTILEHIDALWPVLLRKGAVNDKSWSSKISLPHSYIVPGGRFDEIYYWDSYFTMLGLGAAGKFNMIESMLDNFVFLIDEYGFIPNGNRTYYLGRSQPPFFALMVRLLADCKGPEVLVKYLPAMLKEYDFWMAKKNDKCYQRLVPVQEGKLLNRYFDDTKSPRTEMYMDDVELINKKSAGQALVTEIRAACESGWDFSARWLVEADKLDTIHTTDIVPVDLNCLLHGLEQTIAEAMELTSDGQANVYKSAAKSRAALINTYCWSESKSCYFDYDFKKRKRKDLLSAAAVYPLYFKIASQEQANQVAAVVKSSLLQAGGIVSTTVNSGQQWDSPNGWAPQQWMSYKGLLNYGFNKLANEIRSRWMTLNEKTFRSTGKMMEKYNVKDLELASGGGEYPVQDGFGWTNGVYLAFANEYDSTTSEA